jgi:hypothetical protein
MANSVVLSDEQLLDRQSLGKVKFLIRRLFSRTDRSEYVRGYRTGMLNRKALARVKVGDEYLFQKRYDKDGTNTAVQLLIDVSGSMRGPGIDGAAKTAAQLAEAMASCVGVKFEVVAWSDNIPGGIATLDKVEGLGINNAVTMKTRDQTGRRGKRERWGNHDPDAVVYESNGFGGKGSDNAALTRQQRLIAVNQSRQAAACALTVLKPMNGSKRGLFDALRVAQSLPCGGTPIVHSFKAGAKRMAQMKGFERRFVMLLTDGMVDANEGAQLREQAKKLKAKGITTIGIGLGQNVDVSPYFEHSINVEDPKDLASEGMVKLVKVVSGN